MSLTIDQIEAEAAKLSCEERILLVHRLHKLDEIDDPDEVEAAWDEEIRKRMHDIDSGKVKCVPFEEVMERMKSKFSL